LAESVVEKRKAEEETVAMAMMVGSPHPSNFRNDFPSIMAAAARRPCNFSYV